MRFGGKSPHVNPFSSGFAPEGARNPAASGSGSGLAGALQALTLKSGGERGYLKSREALSPAMTPRGSRGRAAGTGRRGPTAILTLPHPGRGQNSAVLQFLQCRGWL